MCVGVQELCPALDLLCSAVRDSNSDAQSRQFSEQLLNITVNFVNTQIHSVLSNTYRKATHTQQTSEDNALLWMVSFVLTLRLISESYGCFDVSADEDSGVQSCVDVLDQYITKLRTYMKRFPWPAGRDTTSTNSAAPAQEEVQEDEWEQLPTEVTFSQINKICIHKCLFVSKLSFMFHHIASVCICVCTAGSGPSVHPDQSDPQSSGHPEETETSRAAPVSSEDGGSAAGLLLPAAQRPADRQHAPH